MLPTPTPVMRQARELRSIPELHLDPPRAPTRPRPSVTVERDTGPNLTTRRLILLGVGAVVLCVVMSVISAYIVARVVRSSAPAASASATSAAPPTTTTP